MTPRLLCIILTLLVATGTSAQRLRGDRPAHADEPARQGQSVPAQKSSKAATTALPDTVYSTQTYKRGGWFGPLGEISAEDARHRSTSVRFTRRSPKGKWLRIETVDGYGDHVGGIFNPYLVKLGNDADSEASADWAERLGTACIYDIIPDASGDNVVQERAYDKDMNLVYIYTRTPVGTDAAGRRRYVGNYRDHLGRPAEMRPDTTGRYTYGSLVMITEDFSGNDSIVEYMDARGVKKPNGDGVAMEVHTFDSRGDCVRTESRDAAGRPVIDKWSNCGTVTEYDNHHNTIRATYIDDQGRLMAMRSPFDHENNGAASVIRKYDSYGRVISSEFEDTLGRPSTTAYGVARIDIEYDDRGNRTAIRHIGSDGRPHNGHEGHATELAQYDNRGNILNSDRLDADGRPKSIPGQISRIVMEYRDGDAQRTLLQQYVSDGTNQIPHYRHERHPWGERTVYDDSSYRIDSIDSRGNTTFTGYYNADGRPGGVDGWTTMHRRYTYAPGQSSYIESFRMPDGSFDTAGHAVKEAWIDSVAGTDYIRRYRADSVLFETAIMRHSRGYGPVTSQTDVNRFGRPSRAGGLPGVRYLHGDILLAQHHDDKTISALMGRDEFDEPDYFVSAGPVCYYMRNSIPYDEDNRPITDYIGIRNRLPKVMSVEVTDSAAYRLGLLDNDIVVADGIYGCDPRDSVGTDDFRRRYALCSLMQPDAPRSMTVLRADTAAGAYRAVTIPGITGRPSQRGYLLHERYLTRRQLDRIGRAIDSLPGSLPAPLPAGEAPAVLTTCDPYMSERAMPYPARVSDPALLLAVSVPELDLEWRYGQASAEMTSLIAERNADVRHIPAMHLVVTTDGRSLHTISTDSLRLCMTYLDASLPADVTTAMDRLAAAAADTIARMEAAGRTAADTLPLKKLRGRYALQAVSPTDSLVIDIGKDGRYSLTGSTLAYMKDTSGSEITVRITFDTASPRRLTGNAVSLAAEAAYTTVAIDNPPAGDIDEIKQQVDWVFNNSQQRGQFIAMLSWLSPELTARLHLGLAPDGSLKIVNDSGRALNFVKLD